MSFLTEVCGIPTAPFREERVIQYVESFVKARRRLRLSRDPQGNLLIELPGRKKSGARWVFGAHIDHPAMVVRGMVDRQTVEAEFRGTVYAKLMRGAKVRFFDNGREITGQIVKATPEKDNPRAESIRARVSEPVSTDSIGLFDVEAARVRGRKFHSRAIDDLGGAAAALAMIDELHSSPPAATIAVLLTRAEEVGFMGAIAAARRPKLLRKTDRIVAIECSAMQPYAPQGKGPIIRVGDRTSVFHSGLTYFLTRQAEELAKKDRSFRWQRALMPGGTCEATVYDLYGYQASSICVALGNYHNMDRENNRIGAEFIDVMDWEYMVQLFVAIARAGHTYEGMEPLRKRIEERYESLNRHF